jgi:hypothetical protein
VQISQYLYVFYLKAISNYTSIQTGAIGGLQMILFVNQADYLIAGSYSAGFRVRTSISLSKLDLACNSNPLVIMRTEKNLSIVKRQRCQPNDHLGN